LRSFIARSTLAEAFFEYFRAIVVLSRLRGNNLHSRRWFPFGALHRIRTLTFRRPLPPNSGLPELGIINCRSRIYPTSSGGGLGRGVHTDTKIDEQPVGQIGQTADHGSSAKRATLAGAKPGRDA
jgi:hypothetical protein